MAAHRLGYRGGGLILEALGENCGKNAGKKCEKIAEIAGLGMCTLVSGLIKIHKFFHFATLVCVWSWYSHLFQQKQSKNMLFEFWEHC